MKFERLTMKELIRKNHNKRIIKGLKQGAPLNSFSASSSWFPPRPIISKDEVAVEKLYGNITKNKSRNSKAIFNKSKGSSLFLV